MRKVLFIARIFPPETGAAVQRPAKFAKYLSQSGWKPYVVTTQDTLSRRDDSLLRELPATVTVKRVFSHEPHLMTNRINAKWKNNSIVNVLLRGAVKLYSLVYYRIAFPDWAFGWVWPGYFAAAALLKRERINTVYVHSQPPSSLIIGMLLKYFHKVTLVLDYDDPWTTSPNYFPGNVLFRTAGKKLERRILKCADRVLYCKETILREIRETFPGLPMEKFIFIPNGYDPGDFRGKKRTADTDSLVIAYSGTMTDKFCYSPESFFRALRSLREKGTVPAGGIVVRIAGTVSDGNKKLAGDLGLENTVSFAGYVDHEESIANLEQADALLLLIESRRGPAVSAEFAGSMPAKIFEYLYLQKPVLAIVPPGPEEKLLSDAGVAFIARPNDPASVEQALVRLYDGWKKKDLGISPDQGFIGSFDRRRQTEKFAAELNALCDTVPGKTGAH